MNNYTFLSLATGETCVIKDYTRNIAHGKACHALHTTGDKVQYISTNELNRYFRLSNYMDAENFMQAIEMAEQDELYYMAECTGFYGRALHLWLKDMVTPCIVDIFFPNVDKPADRWQMRGNDDTMSDNYHIEREYTDIINAILVALPCDYDCIGVDYNRNTEMLTFTCPACQYNDIIDYLESL